jgi:hypothetical protein
VHLDVEGRGNHGRCHRESGVRDFQLRPLNHSVPSAEASVPELSDADDQLTQGSKRPAALYRTWFGTAYTCRSNPNSAPAALISWGMSTWFPCRHRAAAGSP